MHGFEKSSGAEIGNRGDAVRGERVAMIRPVQVALGHIRVLHLVGLVGLARHQGRYLV